LTESFCRTAFASQESFATLSQNLAQISVFSRFWSVSEVLEVCRNRCYRVRSFERQSGAALIARRRSFVLFSIPKLLIGNRLGLLRVNSRRHTFVVITTTLPDEV